MTSRLLSSLPCSCLSEWNVCVTSASSSESALHHSDIRILRVCRSLQRARTQAPHLRRCDCLPIPSFAWPHLRATVRQRMRRAHWRECLRPSFECFRVSWHSPAVQRGASSQDQGAFSGRELGEVVRRQHLRHHHPRSCRFVALALPSIQQPLYCPSARRHHSLRSSCYYMHSSV